MVTQPVEAGAQAQAACNQHGQLALKPNSINGHGNSKSHLHKLANTVVQLLDHSSVSAGDLNSCFVALNLTDLLKLLNMASLLHVCTQWC